MALDKELYTDKTIDLGLIPEEMQRYKIPNNWVWTKLGVVTLVIGGGTPSTRYNEYYENGTVPWLSPIDLSDYDDIYISHGRKFITELGLLKSSANLLPRDTVLLSTRAPIGYVAIAETELCTSQGFKSFLPSSIFVPQYLYWYLKYNKEFLESRASGTTFKELSAQKCSELDFPLPPLAEQTRIVERIRAMFASLELAKKKIESIKSGYADRRSIILENAFSGVLSEKWRSDNGILNSTMQDIQLVELCESFQYGTSRKSESSGEMAVIRMGNLQGGYIDWNNLQYTSNSDDMEKYKLNYGDVLFNRTNSPELVGKTSIYKGEQPAIFAGYLIRINYKSCLDGEYLNYFLNSKRARDYCARVKSDGVNQSNINAQKLSKLEIPFCSLLEQKEIVVILNGLLEKEKKIDDICSNIIKEIDALKINIFKKAYSGKLGTNNAEDDIPIELMIKGIMALKKVKTKDEKLVLQKREVKLKMDMLQILIQKGKLTPEELKREMRIDIDYFYEELRNNIKLEKVIEIREGKEVYLEAK